MTIKKRIEEELKKVLDSLGVENIESTIDYPADPAHGDYASNIAMIARGKYKGASIKGQVLKSPRELADFIAHELRSENQGSKIFEKVEVAGPGFINFTIASDALLDSLKQIDKSKKIDKKVVVEYSSPNIAKPFTVGHLRSTIIGDAVANLLEEIGHEVIRDNHVGDWGTQFGKQIYAIKEWGNEEKIGKSENPVKELVALYVKFHEEAEKNPELEDRAREWFHRLENGDIEAKRLWKKCIEWSWAEFEKIYKDLGVPSIGEFVNNGRGYGESYFEDKMQPVIDELAEKGLLTEGKEGAKIVEFGVNTKLPPLMIIKKDGATLYATRDLATDKFRLKNYGRNVLIINEVGAEQELYFRQLFELERMLGWVEKDQRVHIKHGLIRFGDAKMSTRKGNTIWLEDVLSEAVRRAVALGKSGEKSADIASMVGIGAIKWNDLKRSPEQEVKFDWDEALSMQGNSGPYVQYAYVRTQSVLTKIKNQKSKIKDNLNFEIKNLKLEPEERELLVLLARFEEIIEQAAEKMAPHIVCAYLFELAQAFNLFYQKHQILNAEDDKQGLRLFLTGRTGKILKKGLNILGIKAPDEM